MTDKLHEAIVKASLETAATETNRWINCEDISYAILSLSNAPAEVAAIIAKAGEGRG